MTWTRSIPALVACASLAAGCGGKKDEEVVVNASPFEQYCGEVAAACNTANAEDQYPAHGNIACLGYAENAADFPLGVVGATTGDSLECRRTHARLALADPVTHCRDAGPLGGNVCGTWCENYCALALKNCTGTNALYPDTATCLSTCAGFPTNGPLKGMSSSVQCRIMEAGEAYLDPAQHCVHASAASPVCI